MSMSEAWDWVMLTSVENNNYTMYIWSGVPDMFGRFSKELSWRHMWNDRKQEAVVIQLARGLLRDGMMTHFRGRLLPVSDDPDWEIKFRESFPPVWHHYGAL